MAKKQKGMCQTKQDQTKQDEADNDYTRWKTAVLKDDKDLHCEIKVVPKHRGIWIKWSLGQGQTAKRGDPARAQELRFRRFGRGWALNGFGDEHKSWTILNRWQRVAMPRRLDKKRRFSWYAFHNWRTNRQANLWHNSRRLVRVLLRGCQVVLPYYFRIGRTRTI